MEGINVSQQIFKVVKVVATILGMAFAGAAFADSQNLGSVAQNVTGSMKDVAELITAAAYVAGLGFAVAAILKFKAHKDNPQQIPVGTPIALLFIAAALIFLPSLLGVSGQTVFGSSAESGKTSGFSTVE